MAIPLFHPGSIRQKFTLGLVLIIGSTMVLFSILILLYELQDEKNELHQRLESLLNESRLNLGSPLWQYNAPHVQDHADALFLNPEVAFVQIRDNQDIIVEKQGDEGAAHTVAGIKNNPDFIWTTSSIQYHGRPVGSIFIAMTQKRIREHMLQESVSALILGIVTVLTIFAAVSFLIRKIVFKPLTQLEASVNEVAKGRLDAKIDTGGTDEISSLANAFAQMIRNLEKTTASKKVLENEIKERKSAEERLSRSLREKEVLLREVHHRVKNNMQMIQSLLSLQLRGSDDSMLKQAFNDANNRIKSMALMHETLYRSDDMGRLDAKGYFENMTKSLGHIYLHPDSEVEIMVEAESVELDIDTAISCGLIVNELVTNAFKHGFKGGARRGRIRLGLEQKPDRIILFVSDNGQGLPKGFNLETVDSLGLKLVKMLTRDQLKGNFEIRQNDELRFEITLPTGGQG